MRYLLLMTTAGSLMFGGYWVWGKLCKDLTTERMKFWALVAVLLAFVVPWAWMKEFYIRLLTAVIRQGTSADRAMAVVRMAEISTQDEAYMTQDYIWLLAIIGVWLLISLRVVVKKFIKFVCARRKLMSMVDKSSGEVAVEELKRLYKRRFFRFRPRIYKSPYENLTMSIGIMRPIILLQEDYSEEELELILKHELYHITRGDLLIRLFLELAGCLHWFNPLIYHLEEHFDGVSETSCDEKVVSGCTKEQRAIYARLIIRSMQNGRQELMLINSLEGDGYADAVERVKLIMNTKQVSRLGKAVATGVFVSMIFVNSLTALAYPNVYHVEEAADYIADTAVGGGGFYFHSDMDADYDLSTNVDFHDGQFIGMDGKIYPINSADTYGLVCGIFGHDKIDGYFDSHLENDNGGCRTEVYTATLCRTCNTIWIKDLHSSHEYTKCPH